MENKLVMLGLNMREAKMFLTTRKLNKIKYL